MSARIAALDVRSAAARDAALPAAIDAALIDTGFLLARGLAIDPGLLAAVYRTSHAFFARDAAYKARFGYRSALENFGYQGLREENLDPDAPADLKETFTMRNILRRPPADERWPSAEFRELMQRFYRAAMDAGLHLQRQIAAALKLEPEFFARHHSGDNVTLRLLYYPASTSNDARQLGAGAHTDYGLLTLLFQDRIGGLEVRDERGDWHPVASAAEEVIVNSGDLLERWSNGRYRSTPHRVQPRRSGEPRLSIAFFLDPDSDTLVEAIPACVPPGEAPRFAPVTAGEHVQQMLARSHKDRYDS